MITISNIKALNKVILSIDFDISVDKTIESIFSQFGEVYELDFANEDDPNNDTSLLRQIYEMIVDGLKDGLENKMQSFSWLFKKNNKF